MGLTRLAVFRPLTILMIILGIVIMGGMAYTFLSVDQYPTISYPIIVVNMQYPQASAEDVEQQVATPIENAVAGVSGIQTITSNSSQGAATVRIQLVEGADANQAALDVQRALARIARTFPLTATAPTVFKADPSARPILNIGLTGAPLDQLYDAASNSIAPQLESVLGVASVNVSGGLIREVEVQVDYSKLAAYNLSVTQVQNAVSAANYSSSAGSIDQGQQTLTIRSLGLYTSLDDIMNVVVANTAGGPLLLRDVANVVQTYKQVTQRQRLDGTDAVGLNVVKDSNANLIQTADGVKATLATLQSALPAGASFHIRNDDSAFTRASLDSVQHDLFIALFMVALVTLVFLHDFRHTLIIILAVPTSMISTFLIMYALGFTLNIITLMALALIIGILVDDSIVVLENIHRHLQLGEAPVEAAINGRSEIGLAAIAITMADVVVYAPIAFMSGFVGQLFREYGLTVVAATLFSMMISFTLTPMLASRWLKHEGEAKGIMGRIGQWWDARFDRFAHFASSLVPLAVRVRWLVALGGIGAIVAIAALVQFHVVGTEYAPQEDDNQFTVVISTAPGTSIAAIDAASQQMEAALRQMPEISSIFASVNAAGTGPSANGSPNANISVQVVPKNQRQRSIFDMMNQVRAIGRTIPGATVRAQAPSPLPGGGGGTSLAINVSGTDLVTLNQVVAQVQDAVSQVPGVVDVYNSSLTSNPEVHVQLDRARMGQLGVTSTAVSNALQTAIGGVVVSEYQLPGQLQQDITVIANNANRLDLSGLQTIPVGGGVTSGSSNTATAAVGNPVVTLGQVATIVPGTGPVQIQHVNRVRTITINGTVAGRPFGDVARDIQTVLDGMSLPAGFTATQGQSVNALNQALGSLAQALALSLILEYMLLVALYESWFYPLAVMCAVPLGLVGSFIGLALTGNTLNMFSIIGMIMAFGLVAKNGILVVDFTNTLRSRGMPRTEALREAVKTRLRPILMTSSTMVAGMFPLALKLEPGAESRAPMAIVVIGAIALSTVLAILVIPATYTLFDDLQGLLMPGRKKITAIEPAPEPHAVPMPQPIPSPLPVPTHSGRPVAVPVQLRVDEHPSGPSGSGIPQLT